MNSIIRPNTFKASIITRSTRKFETIRLEMNTGLKTAGVAMYLDCDDQYSPIEMLLTLNPSSDSFRQMARTAMGISHERAATIIRGARQEQRYGGVNVNNNPSLHTSLSIAPLVLAHLSPRVDFSFANLQPHTIDNLKILALEHENSFLGQQIA